MRKVSNHMRLETHLTAQVQTLMVVRCTHTSDCQDTRATRYMQVPIINQWSVHAHSHRPGSAPPMLCRNALSPTNALGLSVTCPIDLCQRARPSAYLGFFRRGTRCLLLYVFHALISTCWTWRLGLSTNGTDVGAASTPTPLLAVLDALSMRAYGATPSSASSGARQ